MKIPAESAHMKTHGAILFRNVTTATGKRINGSQLSQFKLCVKDRSKGEQCEQAQPNRTESLRYLALLSVISVFTEIDVQIKITLLTGSPIHFFLRLPAFCGFYRLV